jgi:ElaB/YqjD/DUF883 family membrane-anchored ribosome-binding protein
MQPEEIKKAIENGVEAAVKNLELGRMKKAVDETMEEGVDATRRALKRGRRNAEDLVETAEYKIKQHPLPALGITFGVGLGLGAVIGLLSVRNGRH